MRSPADVPDTRTRILEAAVNRFGQDGFDASLRAIAADVGVSAPAILKHFDSKEELRRACDEHVVDVTRKYKTEAMRSADLRATFLTQMAMVDEFQPLIRYVVRSLMNGGDAARNLLTDMYGEAERWMAEGVRTGVMRPSRDERARVKLTFSISLGWMLQSVLMADKELGELDADFWRQTTHELMPPALELYTHGLLTDSTLLDAYVSDRTEPLSDSDPPADPPAGPDTTPDTA
ncbi:transcriptional regulator, TetR family [Prauserella aidingensis]|uniref:TetR/AcrR family transcriptional regulator n=1 Tax=Prauserella aidingensis TaxID=387890 RepID=UPI0020A58772|nr:TetR family transcriptional regulator [Prauserella aidingensis]MCP2251786.1 transcriptional regulator, TetR family [Prauserella aidingensis]